MHKESMESKCPACQVLSASLQSESEGDHLRQRGEPRREHKEMQGSEMPETRLWQHFDCPHCGTSWFRVTDNDAFAAWEGEPDQP
jgi:Zn finger protein HypA/HybF involved in hydrogenase expression